MWCHVDGEPDLFTINDSKYWEIKKLGKTKNVILFSTKQIDFLSKHQNSNIIIFSKDRKFIIDIKYKTLINNDCKYIIKKIKTKAKV